MVILATAKTDLEKLEVCAPDIARKLKLFANERRVRILYHLAANKNELSFAALADGIQNSQSALSRHGTFTTLDEIA
ncbi:MAG: winged helix-turn-helix transcriptional regulator [Rhizobiales bacterium]|nr:winged helix-turn-helix transcriptional regulator [Hyphomicrobiales bacterium]